MSFIKVSPGKACKIAVSVKATWTRIAGTTAQEAVGVCGAVFAYHDCDGFFVRSGLELLNTDNVIA